MDAFGKRRLKRLNGGKPSIEEVREAIAVNEMYGLLMMGKWMIEYGIWKYWVSNIMMILWVDKGGRLINRAKQLSQCNSADDYLKEVSVYIDWVISSIKFNVTGRGLCKLTAPTGEVIRGKEITREGLFNNHRTRYGKPIYVCRKRECKRRALCLCPIDVNWFNSLMSLNCEWEQIHGPISSIIQAELYEEERIDRLESTTFDEDDYVPHPDDFLSPDDIRKLELIASLESVTEDEDYVQHPDDIPYDLLDPSEWVFDDAEIRMLEFPLDDATEMW